MAWFGKLPMPIQPGPGAKLYGHHHETTKDCSSRTHAIAKFDEDKPEKLLKLHKLSHSDRQLAFALGEWLEKYDHAFSKDQLSGLAGLKGLLTEVGKQPHPREYYAHADALFFSGWLGKSVVVLQNDADNFLPFGETKFESVEGSSDAFVTIRMPNLSSNKFFQDHPFQRRVKLLSILLHEMCHAFLLVFGCEGRACASYRVIGDGRGFSDHGPAWTYIAGKVAKIFLHFCISAPNYEEGDPLDVKAGEEVEAEERRMACEERVANVKSQIAAYRRVAWGHLVP